MNIFEDVETGKLEKDLKGLEEARVDDSDIRQRLARVEERLEANLHKRIKRNRKRNAKTILRNRRIIL